MTNDVATRAGSWQLVILAKVPRPGHVKTRLCPPLHPEDASVLAAAALRDTIAAARATTAARRLLILDGDPGRWHRAGFEIRAQRGDGLGERLAHALEDARLDAPLPTLLIGMDTPQVDAGLLEGAGALLASGEVDTVLGPAVDGGYWAIGTRGPTDLFDGVPMSSPRTAAAQLTQLADRSLSCRLLPTRRDVDRWPDALVVAGQAPGTAFASEVTRLLDTLAIEDPVGA